MSCKPLVWVGLTLGLSVILARTSLCGEPPRAVLTAEQLRSKLFEAQEMIRSVYVVYRSYGYDPQKFPKETYLHRIVVAKAPYYLHHVSSHGHGGLDWHEDPFQQRAYITANHLYNEYPVNRTYFESDLRPQDSLPGSLPRDFFFFATGIWPLKARTPPRPYDRPYVLCELAKSKEYSVVQPAQEMVDSRWCHVLERTDYDRLWIDVERGCALLARETHSKDNGALVQRIELGGHREAAPGIWLPAWMRNVQFDYNAPTEEGRKRKVVDARHDVLEIQVNQVDDSLFHFQPPAGALRIDPNHDEPPSQTQPGGLEHLDHLAQWVQTYARPQGPAPSPLGYFAGVPALLIILAWEWRLRWRRRRSLVDRSVSQHHQLGGDNSVLMSQTGR